MDVVSAKLKIVRSGVNPTLGSVELQSRVSRSTEGLTLMALASKPGPYSIAIRYIGPDGIVLREDTIAVAENSQATYTGPTLSENGDSWEHVETLVIHAG